MASGVTRHRQRDTPHHPLPERASRRRRQVDNCILFQGVTIGAGAKLRRCIIDKHVTVPPGTRASASTRCSAPNASPSQSAASSWSGKGYQFRVAVALHSDICAGSGFCRARSFKLLSLPARPMDDHCPTVLFPACPPAPPAPPALPDLPGLTRPTRPTRTTRPTRLAHSFDTTSARVFTSRTDHVHRARPSRSAACRISGIAVRGPLRR